MRYTFDSRIRYSEVGEDGRLTLCGLINYFQDCSTFQSEELGQGVRELIRENKAWVLSSWQIHVKRYPSLGECVRTSTWACGFRGFTGNRNFTMETAAGELLAAAYSIWAYVDTKTGHPIRVTDEVAGIYGYEAPLAEDFGSRKIMIPDHGTAKEPFPVRAHHLDTNHHVNNGQYVYLAGEYLPKDFTVRKLRAEYKQQARLNDMLYPVIYTDGENRIVTLNDKNAKPYVVVEFQ